MTGPEKLPTSSSSHQSFALSPERPRPQSPGFETFMISSTSHFPSFAAQARSLAEAELTISILRRAGEELKLVVDHVQSQLDIERDQVGNLEAKISGFTDALDSVRAEKSRMAVELGQKDEAISALRVRLDMQSTETATLRQTVEKELSEIFSNKISVLESRSREQKQKIAELESKLQHTALTLASTEKRKLEEAKFSASEAENVRRELAGKLELSELAISDLRQQNVECLRLKQNVVQSQIALKNHMAELQKLKMEHAEIFEQKIARDQELEFLGRRVKQLEREKEISDREFAIALQKNATLEQSLAAATEKISALTLSGQQTVQKLEFLEDVRTKLGVAETELKGKSEKISDLNEEISDLQDQLFEQETLRRELANLQARHREISAQVKMRDVEISELHAEQKTRTGELGTLQLELGEWKRKCAELADERRGEKQRWREKTATVQRTLTELGERLHKSQRDKKELEQLAVANKRKFEEKLLEYERRVLVAELPRPPRLDDN